jgi:hypothetical protein
MLKFNTVLKEEGFDPEKVILIRHQDKRSRISLYQAWKSRRQDFETYQQGQKWENRFPEGSSLAAFVVGPEGETLFVGVYDVLAVSQRNGPLVDQLIGPLPAEPRALGMNSGIQTACRNMKKDLLSNGDWDSWHLSSAQERKIKQF